MKRRSPLAAKQTMQWFQRNEPFIYRVAMKRYKMQNRGLSDIDWRGVVSSFTSTVKELAPAYIQARQQKKIMDVQLDRAAKGLPPMEVEHYTPAIKIAPEITPQTEQAITRVASETIKSSANKLLIPAAIGLGLVLVMMQRKRR